MIINFFPTMNRWAIIESSLTGRKSVQTSGLQSNYWYCNLTFVIVVRSSVSKILLVKPFLKSMRQNRLVFLCTVFLLLLFAFSNVSAGDYSNLNIICFSKDGKYMAFEEYGTQDGSGFPCINIYFINVEKFLLHGLGVFNRLKPNLILQCKETLGISSITNGLQRFSLPLGV